MEQVIVYTTNIFSWIISTSIMASILVLFILCIKKALKNKLAPRWHYLLWLLLTLRLLLPWTLESSYSIFNLINSEQSIKVLEVKSQHTDPILSEERTGKQSYLTETYHDNTRSKSSSSPIHITYVEILAGIWVIGVLAFGYCAVRNQRRFVRKLDDLTQIKDSEVIGVFEQCKNILFIKRSIPLLQSNHVTSPAVWGYIKPKILLPKHVLQNLTKDQLRYIFLHELSHFKRNDVGINRIMNAVLLLHWFNPILWYAYYRMREDQEIACDSFVLNAVEPRDTKQYGETMIALLENVTTRVSLSDMAYLISSKKQLMRRIQMINKFKKNSYRLSILGLGTLIVVGGVFLTNQRVGAVRPDQDNNTKMQREFSHNKTQTASSETSDSKTQVASSQISTSKEQIKVGKQQNRLSARTPVKFTTIINNTPKKIYYEWEGDFRITEPVPLSPKAEPVPLFPNSKLSEEMIGTNAKLTVWIQKHGDIYHRYSKKIKNGEKITISNITKEGKDEGVEEKWWSWS